MIGAGLGLAISALSKTNESAIALLPVVLLPIIALGGGMRPIYLMPKAGQVISTIIPSRWSFEANMLHEAEAKQWGGAKNPVPDMTCKLDEEGKNTNPVLVSPDPNDLNPSLNVQGDSAEGTIPRYLITFTDPSGNERVCRASADEQYPRTNPTSHAVAYRHRFSYSLAVLSGMLVALVATVILVLRKRDKDPQ
jgi:hypothetical protein